MYPYINIVQCFSTGRPHDPIGRPGTALICFKVAITNFTKLGYTKRSKSSILI
jgi:hypothetical protein